MDYELVLASDVFNDDNGGYEYGINWINENGCVVDCEWFKTEDERNEAIEEIDNFRRDNL